MSFLSAADGWTGDFLVESGLISLPQLDEAIGLAEAWDSSLSDVIVSQNWLRAFDYYKAVARRFEIPFVDLRQTPPDPTLLNEAEITDYVRELTLPWAMEDGQLVVATA